MEQMWVKYNSILVLIEKFKHSFFKSYTTSKTVDNNASLKNLSQANTLDMRLQKKL
jgi:hypothetical protein